MWYLISEIAIYLVSGFFLGAVVGWFFRGAFCRRNLEGMHVYWTGRLKAMERVNATTRQDLERAGRRVEELDDVLAERHAALERVAKSLREAESHAAELKRERQEEIQQHQESSARMARILTRAESRVAKLLLVRDELIQRLEEPESAVRDSGAETPESLALQSDEVEVAPFDVEALEHLGDQLAGQGEPATEAADQAMEESPDAHEGHLEVQPIQAMVTELAGLHGDQPNRQVDGLPDTSNGYEDVGASAVKDDLTQIRGIGRILEGRLNSVGIYTFEQIAEWTPEDVGRIAERIKGLQGRIARDSWVGQARMLARSKN